VVVEEGGEILVAGSRGEDRPDEVGLIRVESDRSELKPVNHALRQH
jgi:hypothetical protein